MEGGDDGLKKSKGSSMKIKRQTSKSGSVKSKKKSGGKTPPGSPLPTQDPIEMLTPKQNGYVGEDDGGEESEEKIKHNASIKGMWKKAFKSLKSNDKQTWLSKKGSLRRKEEEPESEPEESSKEIDPVYSLLKCAADLPKVPKSQKEAPCSGHLGGRGDSSGSTSKASSPSSSAPHCSGRHGHPHSRTARATSAGSTSPTSGGGIVSNRDHMHHIVDESMGSEFRTFYKLTSPVRKLTSHHSYEGPKKHAIKSSALEKY